MQLVAVCDDSMFMFANKSAEELEEKDECIVYNKDTGKFAPKLCMGSWTARVNPWLKPTDEQIEEAEQWLKSEMITQVK